MFGRHAERDHVAGDLPLQLGRGPLGDDAAVVDDRQSVAERVRLLQVVRGEEDGDAALAQAAHLVPDPGTALRVEAGGRLVQEQQRRLVDQAHADVQPTLLAARVGLRLTVGRLVQLEQRQQVGRAPTGLLRAQP